MTIQILKFFYELVKTLLHEKIMKKISINLKLFLIKMVFSKCLN